MKLLVLTALLIICVNSAFASGREGGGGNIEVMRKAKTLSKNQLNSLLKDNGATMKKSFMTPMIRSIRINQIKDEMVLDIFATIERESGSLKSDISETKYVTNCSCPKGKDMCTENSARANICVDVKRLAKSKLNMAELIGLFFHEHSHHFVGELDHTYNYAFGNYFTEEFKKNDQGQKTFAGKEINAFEESQSILAPSSLADAKIAANMFCIWNTYSQASSFQRLKIPDLQPSDFHFFNTKKLEDLFPKEGRLSPINSRMIFSQISCV